MRSDQGQEESSGTEAKHQATVEEMVDAYREASDVGLENIRLENLGVFARGAKDKEYLLAHMDADAHAL